MPPFSTRNLLLTKGRSDGRGKIEPPANRECSPFRSSPLVAPRALRPSYRDSPFLPSFLPLPLSIPSSFPSLSSFALPSFCPFSSFFFVTTSRKTSGQPRRMRGRTRRTEKVAETRSRDSRTLGSYSYLSEGAETDLSKFRLIFSHNFQHNSRYHL